MASVTIVKLLHFTGNISPGFRTGIKNSEEKLTRHSLLCVAFHKVLSRINVLQFLTVSLKPPDFPDTSISHWCTTAAEALLSSHKLPFTFRDRIKILKCAMPQTWVYHSYYFWLIPAWTLLVRFLSNKISLLWPLLLFCSSQENTWQLQKIV